MTRDGAVVAVHLLLLQGDSVLLLRRANTGYEDGNYSVPAGHVEVAETVARAAIREAAEEVGMTLQPSDLAFALFMHRQAEQPRIDFFFAVSRWVGEPQNLEREKCDQLRWAPLDDLPRNVIPYVRLGIERFRAGNRYAEFP